MSKNILIISSMLILLFSNCLADKESLSYPKSIKFLNKNLQLKYTEGNLKKYIYEYVDESRTLDNWVSLLAVRNYYKYQPKSILAYTIKNLKNNVPNIKFSVLEHPEKMNTYILEFMSSSSNKKVEHQNFHEFNIWYFFPINLKETISIQYAFRYYGNNKLNIKKWTSSKEYVNFLIENKKNFISDLEQFSYKVIDYTQK